MDFALELLMVVVLLAFMLRAAWQGRPGPSVFVAILAGICAVLFTTRQSPHGDMFVAWGLSLASAAIGLLARQVSKQKQQVEPE